MKKAWIILTLGLMLSGCGVQSTWETIADDMVQASMLPMQQVLLQLPEEVSTPVMENGETGTLYVCDGYTLTLHTTPAGDLNQTVHNATGFSKEELHMIETGAAGIRRYQCVWTAAGENENQVGRLCVLDDGAYYYVLTAMAGESVAGQLRPVWNEVFDSFRLVSTQEDVNTGS